MFPLTSTQLSPTSFKIVPLATACLKSAAIFLSDSLFRVDKSLVVVFSSTRIFIYRPANITIKHQPAVHNPPEDHCKVVIKHISKDKVNAKRHTDWSKVSQAPCRSFIPAIFVHHYFSFKMVDCIAKLFNCATNLADKYWWVRQDSNLHTPITDLTSA